MDYPVFWLRADMNRRTKYNVEVINKDDVPTDLWVRIPDYIALAYTLYKVCYMKPTGPEPTEWEGNTEHVDKTPWYKFVSSIFDWEVGTHEYRLRLENTQADDTLDLFFRYIVQDNHPSKPYLYMDEENRCGCV